MANRLQDPSLLLNSHLIYSNETAASFDTSPSALFINPSLQTGWWALCIPLLAVRRKPVPGRAQLGAVHP